MEGEKQVKLEYKNGCWYVKPVPFRDEANLIVQFDEKGKLIKAKVLK